MDSCQDKSWTPLKSCYLNVGRLEQKRACIKFDTFQMTTWPSNLEEIKLQKKLNAQSKLGVQTLVWQAQDKSWTPKSNIAGIS
ncbi:MAG: hypothetical protein DRR08_27925 [Candidatus Parabeggiatoa sp. nov. 2]|nr:MAG: hypothetical protein B6247_26295 [Beggiatoa sp. 4572_84]RKZ52783.1 MAG: hypothetical protein DRR08_27925 [Gammaproteobacteria bacterium]